MAQTQEQAQQILSVSINEIILNQLRDLKESQRELRVEIKDTRKELNARIDRMENRIDKIEEKIDANQKELNDRIDRLVNKIDSSSNHGQIATISAVGIGVSTVSITLGVLYALLFK